MTGPRHRIVVAIDLTEYAEIVLEHALDQAARHSASDLHFLYVANDPGEEVEAIKRQLAALVLPAIEELDGSDWRVGLHVRAGATAEEIASFAGEISAHLIVVGRFGSHRPHRRIGAVAARIIDLAPCPVLVVGLSGQEGDDANAQCRDCIEVRASYEGTRWFCDAHRGDRMRLSTIVLPHTSWGGSPMW